MKKISALAILVAIMVSGCTISASCEFTNASGLVAVVRQVSESRELSLGQVEPGRSIKLEQISSWGSVEISAGGKVMRYRLEEPLGDCVEFRGWGPWSARVFSAELGPDLQLWVNCSSGKVPVKQLAE